MDIGAISLIMLFMLAVATGGAIVALSALIGRRRPTAERKITYECGLDPIDQPRHRFSVKFFLVAVLFIVFDVEVVFLYPWALTFRRAAERADKSLLLVEMVIFLAILGLGLLYAWGRGALEWED